MATLPKLPITLVSSYEPERLLKLSRSLFGDPLQMEVDEGESRHTTDDVS